MAADDRPIIIKRVKKMGGGHHGGAWKVAYADFVTAMMAFFLLLWLLATASKEQKEAIADYFAPTISISDRTQSVSVLDGQPAVMQTVSGGAAAQAEIEGEDEESTSGAGGENENDGTDTETAEDGAKPLDEQEVQEAMRAQEAERFEEVKKQIQQVIDQTPELSGLKDNLQVDQTPEGLRIQLLDKEKESMFASGSANMEARSQKLLALVAQAVKDMPNKLAISGHTDATPFAGTGGRTNWELSSERANAARRVLVEQGVDPTKVQNVVGRADTDPFIKENPSDPQNRRISIVLLTAVPPAQPPAPAAAPAAPAVPAGPPAEIVPSEGATGEPPLEQN